MTSIKWNGREVKSPFWRPIAAAGIVLWVALLFPIGMSILFGGLILTAPFHPIFWAFGRKGIFRGNGEIVFDMTSFDRR